MSFGGAWGYLRARAGKDIAKTARPRSEVASLRRIGLGLAPR
jgi:hypothetical protein